MLQRYNPLLGIFFHLSSLRILQNNHYWGDQWNGEDLSIYSKDDKQLPSSPSPSNESTTTLDQGSPSYSQSQFSESVSIAPSNLKQTLSSEDMSSSAKQIMPEKADVKGFRAAEAYIRPTPISTHGDLVNYGFDLEECKFTLSLSASSSTPEDAPTEVFLPEVHFTPDSTSVEATGGKWTISVDTSEKAAIQKLRWWHAEGEQTLTVQGTKRTQGESSRTDEEVGYLEQYARSCLIM